MTNRIDINFDYNEEIKKCKTWATDHKKYETVCTKLDKKILLEIKISSNIKNNKNKNYTKLSSRS